MVTLEEIKSFLGLAAEDSSNDAFLQLQIDIISQAVEGYCNRKFSQGSYVQYIFREDFEGKVNKLFLHNFPILSISSFSEADTKDSDSWVPVSNYRHHNPTGVLTTNDCFFRNGKVMKVEYTAGHSEIPAVVKSVLYGLIKERFNKRLNGIDLDFGSDVQRISIPGAIAIDFDYSLNQNERKSAFGVLLGNYLNVLDPYRSERVIVGASKLSYVEEVIP